MIRTCNFLLLILISFFCISCADSNKEASTATEEKKFVEPKKTLKLAFGSCNKQYNKQELWDDVMTLRPAAWIWLGDNIYGDTEDMKELQRRYEVQYQTIPYRRMRDQIDVYGIWDDHDYGKNDAGKEYKMKRESRDLLFAFLQLPKSDPAWQREGAYQSHMIHKKGFKLKLILLDSRYFREKPSKKGKKYSKEYGPDILGDLQWEWLIQELEDPSIDFFILGNGIQVVSQEHNFESWSNFPSAREKLFKIIENTKSGKVILLSGDRHISELSAIQLEGLKYPLYDITSSGLTHPWKNFPGEENQHRIGKVVNDKNFSVLEFDRNEENQIKVMYTVWGDHLEKLQELELF